MVSFFAFFRRKCRFQFTSMFGRGLAKAKWNPDLIEVTLWTKDKMVGQFRRNRSDQIRSLASPFLGTLCHSPDQLEYMWNWVPLNKQMTFSQYQMPEKVIIVAYVSEERTPQIFRKWETLTKTDVSPSLATAIDRCCSIHALRNASRHFARRAMPPGHLVATDPRTMHQESLTLGRDLNRVPVS